MAEEIEILIQYDESLSPSMKDVLSFLQDINFNDGPRQAS
jgi:hypothetical protein